MRAGAEIAGIVAVACRVAHPVLRQIAGVRHASVVALRHGVERRHADTRRQILAALLRQLERDAAHHAVDRVLDVDHKTADAEVIRQKIRHVDVVLLAVGHQHADHAVFAERLDAQRRYDRAVLAAGNADHGVAARTVFFKEFPDPFHTVAPNTFYVKHDSSSVRFAR